MAAGSRLIAKADADAVRAEMIERYEKLSERIHASQGRARNEAVAVFGVFAAALTLLAFFGVDALISQAAENAANTVVDRTSLEAIEKKATKAQERIDQIAAEVGRKSSSVGQAHSEVLKSVSDARKLGYLLPKGTILSFAGGQEELDAMLASGWAVCDGEDGRPDLDKCFLRGTKSLSKVTNVDGEDTHDHGQKATGNAHSGTNSLSDGYDVAGSKEGPTQATGLSHYHNIALEPDNHVPYHMYVVFLIKL